MDISTIGAAAPAPASRDGLGLAADFNAFLRLLTTQLANQDPLSPLDPNQFTQQLVQFSGVEQAIKTNQSLGQLIALAHAGEATRALDYIGVEIEARSNWIDLGDSGEATVPFNVPAGAAEVRLRFYDTDGRLVFEGHGSAVAGEQDFAWHGYDLEGRRQPAGRYRVEAAAVGAAGGETALATKLRGRVDAVELREGGITLAVGSLSIPLFEVTLVRRPPAAA